MSTLEESPHALGDLYWNDHAIHTRNDVTIGKAAQALRNFLEHGAPDWETVLDVPLEELESE